MVQRIRMSCWITGPRRGGQSKSNGVGHSTHRAVGNQRDRVSHSLLACSGVRPGCPSSASSSPRRTGVRINQLACIHRTLLVRAGACRSRRLLPRSTTSCLPPLGAILGLAFAAPVVRGDFFHSQRLSSFHPSGRFWVLVFLRRDRENVFFTLPHDRKNRLASNGCCFRHIWYTARPIFASRIASALRLPRFRS